MKELLFQVARERDKLKETLRTLEKLYAGDAIAIPIIEQALKDQGR